MKKLLFITLLLMAALLGRSQNVDSAIRIISSSNWGKGIELSFGGFSFWNDGHAEIRGDTIAIIRYLFHQYDSLELANENLKYRSRELAGDAFGALFNAMQHFTDDSYHLCVDTAFQKIKAYYDCMDGVPPKKKRKKEVKK